MLVHWSSGSRPNKISRVFAVLAIITHFGEPTLVQSHYNKLLNICRRKQLSIAHIYSRGYTKINCMNTNTNININTSKYSKIKNILFVGALRKGSQLTVLWLIAPRGFARLASPIRRSGPIPECPVLLNIG